MSWLRKSFCALFAGMVLTSASQAEVSERPVRAVLLLPPCLVGASSVAELREALTLELRAQQIELAAPESALGPEDVLLEVDSGCEPEREQIVLRAIRGTEQRERSVSVLDVSEGSRSRALALSLAELVEIVLQPTDDRLGGGDTRSAGDSAASGSLLLPEATQKAPQPPTQARASPTAISQSKMFRAAAPTESVPTPRGAAWGVRIAIAPEARWFLLGSALWGGRAQLDLRRLSLGASWLGGQASAPAGSVAAAVMHGSIGFRASESKYGRRLLLAWGPRIGLGIVRAEGISNPDASGGRIIQTYTDAALFGLGELRLEDDLRAGAGVELGYARGIIALADGERTGYFGGVLLGAAIHLAVGL